MALIRRSTFGLALVLIGLDLPQCDVRPKTGRRIVVFPLGVASFVFYFIYLFLSFFPCTMKKRAKRGRSGRQSKQAGGQVTGGGTVERGI